MDRQAFEREGYFIWRELLDPVRDFTGVIAAYDAILDELGAPADVPGQGAERIAARTTGLYTRTHGLFSQHLDISLPPRAQLPPDIPMCMDPAVFELLTNPVLLDAVETVLGPEIAVNPVNHVRIKPPQALMAGAGSDAYAAFNVNNRNGLMAETPWHQDLAVFTPDADEVEVLTVWFPLTDASIEKGCLKVIPGSHVDGHGLRDHCPSTTSDLQIPDALVPEAATPLPMVPGDVLFLHRRTVHASLPNLSTDARWSFDLRYQPAGLANGRAVLPSFTARSQARPEEVMASAAEWAAMWRAARDRLIAAEEVPKANRWSADAPMCA